MAGHLLNLRVLADQNVDDYSLLRFEGREAISEPFDYRLEIIAKDTVTGTRDWIGKLAEFDVTWTNDEQRVFAGRIYETRLIAGADRVHRILVRVRPAYYAVAYGRATHFIQDRTTKDIFDALTADVSGLVTNFDVSGVPGARSYAVRYDETEFEFLGRLLAQDGIMYFFTYDRSAGPFRHKMHLVNKASAYLDVQRAGSKDIHLKSLDHEHRARAIAHVYHAFEVNQLDTPWNKQGNLAGDWGQVYSHGYEDITGEAMNNDDLDKRRGAHNDAYDQGAETISGSSEISTFFAGGRIPLDWAESGAPERVVLTSVEHSAYDPWMLGEGKAEYSNRFTAMDAAKPFRPPAPVGRRRAPGPLLGVVATEKQGDAAPGEAKVDDKSRVPVAIAEARDYSNGSKPLPKVVWLPVQQQWAHSTHGAQFFPRIGTRVIIDFLYGDPDLPIITGTMYTPSQKYPFDPKSKVTQSGWRSVTDKNGSITQEIYFEDKPSSEEIKLYTGRDYRREIDNDDWGTIKNNQTLVVKGKQEETIEKTRTITITQKSLVESKQELELKVGQSTITMTPSKITIKAPQIEIQADATLSVSAGAKADYKAPMTQHNADALMVIKGGVVMIN
jgi:type VI secretion system secreted protein VgrG